MSRRILPLTPVNSHEDVHDVIDQVQDRSWKALTALNFSGADAGMFSMILSELLQNIIEHAEVGGEVSIDQGNAGITIEIRDYGVGFRGSLAREHAARYGATWGDAAAMEGVLVHGLTRFRDPGRGQGLKQVQSRVGRWNGRMVVETGEARAERMGAAEWIIAGGAGPLVGVRYEISLPRRERYPTQEARG